MVGLSKPFIRANANDDTMKTLHFPTGERAQLLKQCPLFTDLPDSVLNSLSAVTVARSYSSGETLFMQKEPVQGFYVILEGEIKVSRYGPDGREQVLHILSAGETCGEAAVFKGQKYPATAEALSELKTLFISREDFIDLGRRQSELLLNMLAVMTLRLRHFVNLVDDLSLKEVSSRLAKYLLTLSRRQGGRSEIEIETTKSTIASRIGTVSETLSRTLTRMQKKGLIDVRGKQITLLDLDALQALARGEKL